MIYTLDTAHTSRAKVFFTPERSVPLVQLSTGASEELQSRGRNETSSESAQDVPMKVVIFPGTPSQPASLRLSLTLCPFQQAPESSPLTCTTPQGASLAPYTLLKDETNELFIHFNIHISTSSLLITYTMNQFIIQSGSWQYYLN